MSSRTSSPGARQTRRTSGAGAAAEPPVAAYTFETWEEELYRLYALGADPDPCPQCGSTGFFGPRFAEPNLRLRSCRFCGFWQEIAEAPQRAIPLVHDCESWPQAARAPYLWWVPPSRSSLTCPFCDAAAPVAAHRVAAPSDEPEHPWWKVPQGRPADYYRRFWENWEATKGRVVL